MDFKSIFVHISCTYKRITKSFFLSWCVNVKIQKRKFMQCKWTDGGILIFKKVSPRRIAQPLFNMESARAYFSTSVIPAKSLVISQHSILDFERMHASEFIFAPPRRLAPPSPPKYKNYQEENIYARFNPQSAQSFARACGSSPTQ